MLALYDRNAEAPAELKVIDTLYQPRGKQPVALNNTFEDEVVRFPILCYFQICMLYLVYMSGT